MWDFYAANARELTLGPPGVGKTHLAVALAMKAAQVGASIYFISMEDLLEERRDDRLEKGRVKGRSYYKSALVNVDEAGYTPVSRRTAICSTASWPPAM